MTTRIHITIHKPHDAIVKLVMLDREGNKVPGTSAVFGPDCCEASDTVTVFQDQSLWIGENEPCAAEAANARIADLEHISLERHNQLTAAQARLNDLEQLQASAVEHLKKTADAAHATISERDVRIADLETQLAAKSATKRSK